MSALTPETDEEIIATAMLLGAEFEKGTAMRDTVRVTHMWRCLDSGRSTGWYHKKTDAAVGFLHKRGFRLDFNGNIQEST